MNWKSRLAILLLIATGAVANGGDEATKAPRATVVLTDAARRIHADGFVFDGHNDLAWEMREHAGSSFDRRDIARLQPEMHTDIPRLRAGNVGAQFWSVYVSADSAKDGLALQQTLEQIELVKTMIARYGETFELARTVADIERIRRAGKIASLIGVEGGHSIEDSLANLRRLRELGAAYMTLTHRATLSWVDSATDDAQHQGLTPFGEEVVREMNRLGMLVDLSHVSDDTMRHAIRVSRAPVIFSHSSARAVAAHPRNVPDDVLLLVQANDGLVMVNFFSGFVVPEAAARMVELFAQMRKLRAEFPNADDFQRERKRLQLANPYPAGTIHDVVDHIDHIVRVAGIEHVGLGSDFDGVDKLPAQLEDVAAYPLITQELLNRGYTAEQIHRIESGNILRVMRRAEEVAAAK